MLMTKICIMLGIGGQPPGSQDPDQQPAESQDIDTFIQQIQDPERRNKGRPKFKGSMAEKVAEKLGLGSKRKQ